MAGDFIQQAAEWPLKDAFTIAAASVGAVLGVMNTWSAISQRRVRLIVRPGHARLVDGAGTVFLNRFSIEVTNLSNFSVTITEVGMKNWDGERLILIPDLLHTGDFPRRLESRSSFTAYANWDDARRLAPSATYVYAKTACGKQKRGTSGAFRQMQAANDFESGA